MGKDTRLNTLPKLTIPELIKLQAHEYGDKYALVTEQQSITYAESVSYTHLTLPTTPYV